MKTPILKPILAALAAAAIGLTSKAWALSSSDIGKVVATDGKLYKTVSAATNAGTTASGVIVFVGEAGSV